jgi:uncharacterized membrane protein YccC
LAVAFLLARGFSLQHGFWVELATLTVVRSGAVATTRSVGQAVVGTSVGVAVAFAVINAAGGDVAAYALLTPLAIAMAIYLRAAFNFAAGQAGFTLSVLVLFSLLRPAGWHIGIVRLEDVLVGAASGLAASVVAWPHGSVATVGPATADLIDASCEYLKTALQHLIGSWPTDTAADRLGPRRQAVMSAMIRTESAFSQVIAERSDQSATMVWSPVVATANRLWYAADIISAAGPGRQPEGQPLMRALSHLDDAAQQANRQLRRRKAKIDAGPRWAPVLTEDGDPLAAWIDDLADQLETLLARPIAGDCR